MYTTKVCQISDIAPNLYRSIDKALEFNENVEICVYTQYAADDGTLEEALVLTNKNLHYLNNIYTKQYGKSGGYKLWTYGEIKQVRVHFARNPGVYVIEFNNGSMFEIRFSVQPASLLERTLLVLQRYVRVEITRYDK